ncbi:tail fiber assembly protein [Xenorhabdus sp. 42]|uniref:tail fiber assembly protein n=1 Tax=Xenorhabdus szentirmaii TaxID=290112 RepID=UPI00198FB68B|nr:MULTISPECIES: tail fiber assembly protein [unclassified Xenorhabdus]MBD2820350.1 tail fiber assembly protein [Xenorhabdus sp. 42]MBD2824362.1 tail fiber assembly protein [Xenorhabdus sp. 5]
MANYTTNIQLAEFDEKGLAKVAGWVKVYICHVQTREFLGASYDSVPVGFSVVADAYRDAPELPDTENTAVIRAPDGKIWLHAPDYRGQTVYHTETQQETVINYIGELKPEHTLLAPCTEFDQWDGKNWVTDTAAQHQYEIQQAEAQRYAFLHEAEERIRQLERRKRLDMATEREVALLNEWEIYSVKLADINIEIAPDIEWPEQPE